MMTNDEYNTVNQRIQIGAKTYQFNIKNYYIELVEAMMCLCPSIFVLQFDAHFNII